LRVYGRIPNGQGGKTWVVVQTDAQGNNDLVYVTALAQYLLLNLGESPFYGFAGIPAEDSVVQQVAPDYYVSVAQQLFAPYFASLIITRQADSITPIYNVNILTHQGVQLSANVPIPT
jgi:hypothetical protein